MVDFKELGEGVALGCYTLEHWIRRDSRGTFFAVLTEDGERLLMKLVPEEGPDAEQQFATWQRSRHLRHGHLVELRDVGRSELSGARYIYGVFEYPDDMLAVALQQGPLNEPETRGVLEATLAALRYLHGQGMVHGAVDPDHIVAVGETVKLSTDALRESDDLEGHPEDVRQFGELIRTLRAPEPLSEPLATVVRNATTADARQRWTLAEIARAIEPAPVILPPEPAVPVPPPAPAAIEPLRPSPVLPPRPAATERIRRYEEVQRPSKAFPKWIIAGVAILLFSILIFNLQRKPATVHPVPVAPVSAPLPNVATAPATPPTPTPKASTPITPAPRKPSPITATAPATAATPAPAKASSGSAIWRVIAFTYRSRDVAAKKAQQINSRWPDLHAGVFAPKELHGYYLVALGDRMDREEAAQLQRKARSLGLPRDIYVQNYRE